MNIGKINAVNFTSKTETQNENKSNYKKSHTGAITGLLLAGAMDAAPHMFPKNKIAKGFKFLSSEQFLANDLAKMFKMNVSPAMKKVLGAAGIAIDLYFGYEVGKWVDRKINKKRAAKAEAAQTTAAQSVDN